MMARAVLLASLVTLVGFSVAAPTAAAQDVGCAVGSSEPYCLVSVQLRECVTDPCDTMDVCVAYGRVCAV